MRDAVLSLLIALALALPACTPRESRSPEGPEASALRLFEVARRDPAPEAEIASLVDLGGSSGGGARLLDALEALRNASAPGVTGTTPLDGGARVLVDLAADLPGGARASYTVETRRGDDGVWRVGGFWGPGVGWPDRASPSAEGLSVSPPPR